MMGSGRVKAPERGYCAECGDWGYCEAHRVRLSPAEWLTWCCWRGGMSLEQTAYSLKVTLSSVQTYRARMRFKGWRRQW